MRDGIHEVALFTPDSRINQHKAGERVGVVQEDHIADAPGNWCQVKLHRDQHDQHHAPPEDRHGVAGQREAHGGMVKNRATLDGSQYPNRDTHRGGENHGADAKLQRRFKTRHELVPHRKTAFQRNP